MIIWTKNNHNHINKFKYTEFKKKKNQGFYSIEIFNYRTSDSDLMKNLVATI